MADAPLDDVVLTVPAKDGQYHVRSTPGADDMWPDTTDGLFVGEDNWFAVLCGTSWGPIDLTLRPGQPDTAPDLVDGPWDMIAERSLDCSDGTFTIHDLYSSTPPTVVEVPTGWIRVRLAVHGRTRASTAIEPIATPVERHALHYWPTPTWTEPTVISGPDDHALLLHPS